MGRLELEEFIESIARLPPLARLVMGQAEVEVNGRERWSGFERFLPSMTASLKFSAAGLDCAEIGEGLCVGGVGLQMQSGKPARPRGGGRRGDGRCLYRMPDWARRARCKTGAVS